MHSSCVVLLVLVLLVVPGSALHIMHLCGALTCV